jgi:hypothetical protein
MAGHRLPFISNLSSIFGMLIQPNNKHLYTMKKYFIAVVIFNSFISGVFAQADPQQISNINKTRKEIKSDVPNFQKIDTIRNSSGSRDAYSNGKELKLVIITAKDNEHNINKYTEWYFSDGHLIYCEQLWTNNVTGTTINHEKFYLSGTQMIDWIKTGDKHVDALTDGYKKMESTLIAYGEKLETEYANKLK